MGFWLGEHDDFELSLKGAELLEEVASSGRGALILGAHLGIAPAAVIGPELMARLVDRDVPAALARRAADLLEALVAARYGGPAVPWDPTLIEELATSLRSIP